MSTNALSKDLSEDQTNQSQQLKQQQQQQKDAPKDHTPGTIVTERYLYRLSFSPTESAIQSPYSYTIEERQSYTVAKDQSLQPLGEKSILFRGAGSTRTRTRSTTQNETKTNYVDVDANVYTMMGPALYAVEGLKLQQQQQQKKNDKDKEKDKKNDKDKGGHEDDCSSSYVMALYCMEHPEMIQGRGLEVGCREGIGGILSVIGAGLASDPHTCKYPQTSTSTTSEDAIANANVTTAPTPKKLSKLLMTDRNQALLSNCRTNLQSGSFPASKVKLGLLDWNKDVQEEMKDQCQFIFGCHSARDVLALARTVAYALKCSPFDGENDGGGENDGDVDGGGGGLRSRASFVHIEPEHRENVDRLQKELEDGYRMNAEVKDIVLERVHLVPLIKDSQEDSKAQLKDDVDVNVDVGVDGKDDIGNESGGYVEYQNIDTSGYSALVGYHNKDYYGLNGRYFFPSEQARADRKSEEIAAMLNAEGPQKVPVKGKGQGQGKVGHVNQGRGVRRPPKEKEIAEKEARLGAREEERIAIANAKAAEDAEKAKAVEKAKAAEEAKKAKAVEDAEKAKAMEDAKKAKAVEETEKAKAMEDAKKAKAVEEAEKAKAVKDAKKAKAVEEAKKAKAVEEAEKARPEIMEKSETEKMNRVRTVYLEWCGVFQKEADESRFSIFASNFIAMEAIADDTGNPFQLNQWYDLTEDEFRAQQPQPPPQPPQPQNGDKKSVPVPQVTGLSDTARTPSASNKAGMDIMSDEAKLMLTDDEARAQADEEARLEQVVQEGEERIKAEYIAGLEAKHHHQIAQEGVDREAGHEALRLQQIAQKDEALRLQQSAQEADRKKAEYKARKRAEKEVRQQQIAQEEARRQAEYQTQLQTDDYGRKLRRSQEEAKRQAEYFTRVQAEEEARETELRHAAEDEAREYQARQKTKEEVRQQQIAQEARLREDEARKKAQVEAKQMRAVETKVRAKAEQEAIRIADSEGMMSVERERFVADAKMNAIVEFKSGKVASNATEVETLQQTVESNVNAQEERRREQSEATAINEYNAAVEAEKKAMSEAQAKADEWYRLAEIEAKAKIVTQEAHARLASEEARISAEEAYRTAAEAEKWAMVQAQEKADEWYRIAQVEAETKSKGEAHINAETSVQSSISKNAEGSMSAKSERILDEERIMKAARRVDSNNSNHVSSMLSGEAQEAQAEAGVSQIEEEARQLRATEARIRAKAEKEAMLLADAEGMLSVERERLIAEAKVNAVVEFNIARATEAEEVAKLKTIAGKCYS
jgi:hypothetical protein